MRTVRLFSIVTLLFAFALCFGRPVAAQETEQKPKQEQPRQGETNPAPGQGQPGQGLPGQGEGQAEGRLDSLRVDMDLPDAVQPGEIEGLMQESLSGATLSDAEVLHIFITANRGEILASEPIGDGAEPEVRTYAQKMVRTHADVLRRADSLAAVMAVDPQANLVSNTLTQVAQGIAGRLEGLNDPDHRDMQYMASQVGLHQQTLDLLDFVLIPNAQDQNLRNLLSQTRAHVLGHLEQARKIHDDLD